jgi:hypothetical protein
MIQNTLLFSTKFNVVPTTGKFVLTDLSPYAGEGIALTNVKGVFKIEGPSGIIYNNTNFAAPDIAANVSLIFNSVSLPLDTDGNILKGTYVITYKIRVAGGVQSGDYTFVDTSYYCYVAPVGDIQVTNSVRLAKVTSQDLTSYPINGIVPTISRTHTLWYPSSLGLSPTVSGLAEIQLSYPNVYTGTYTGKISTVASYVFTDGLIVDYLITAVDETIVDNKTLCDIYCGIKNLTNEMLTARSTGDFGKADKIQETLSLVSILFTLYDDAITCGKEDDATNWLNQIIAIANITVGCGCTGDEPTLVIPDGGAGSGGDVNVLGDSSFGTAVTSSTVGSTTTYTVRLTETYKDLILSALQSQDLSVTAFRAAGIPEEARGVTVTPITSGGGTISLTPGVSKKVLVLTGSPSLSSSLTVQTVGTPIDGDSFIVDYRATLTPNGNNVTIFGLGLSPSEAASGNCLIYTWYAASNTTWYAKLISNQAGSAIQDGLAFWVAGSDFVLSKTVLYGSNPSLIYKNIQASGSGSNPPTGTTASNTWWQFVGNKSALYDSSDNIVFDVTSGKPLIIPTLNNSASTFNFLVLEGQEVKTRALATLALAGTTLTTDKILVGGASNIAVEKTLNSALLRAIPVGNISGPTFYIQNLINSGTITIDPSLSTRPYVLNGTVTLIGNVSVVANVGTSIPGDNLWIDYKSIATLGGNSLTILGVTISAADALAGNFGIYGYFDSGSSVWVGRKISYGVALPIGTVNQTVRYNSSNVLVADPNVLQDNVGNLIAAVSVKSGSGHSGIGTSVVVAGTSNVIDGNNNIVGGAVNTVSGANNLVSGNTNTVAGIRNTVSGQQNNITGNSNLVSGQQNTVSDNFAVVTGVLNSATGITKIIGSANTGTGSGGCTIEGDNNSLDFFGALYVRIIGNYAKAVNSFTQIFSTGNGALGKHQEEKGLLFGTTTSATPLVLKLDVVSLLFTLQPNAAYIFQCKVVGIQSAGSAGTVGDTHAMVIKGAVKNIAGTITLVGTQVVDGDFSDAAASTWTAVFSASTSTLNLTVTGQANKTIEWTACLTAVNAGY